MQEFESISASSYDPSALATKLTAKAADGWSVVAIVPTGGDVTAFLSRDKADADAAKPATSEADKDDKPADEMGALVLPAKDGAASETKAEEKVEEPVSEPSGWAIAPEAAAATAAAAATTPTLSGTGAGPATTPETQPAVTVPAAAAAAAATPAPATPAPAAVATPDPAPAPAVPAGWYADPAGRFELRYWDGTTWTEHVSRSGQQFTDPPVA
jgi:hypothetical protein